jgi:hypothetical protein
MEAPTKSLEEVIEDFQNIYKSCPYCESKNIVKASYHYKWDGTRTPSFKCKDCNHTFSLNTPFKEKTGNTRTDQILADLKLFGLIEGTDNLQITPLGLKAIKEHKVGKTHTQDNLIINLPFWKDMVHAMPIIHPSKEMFYNALKTVLKEDIPNQHKCEWLWFRYNDEVLPALERIQSGIKGYQGITICRGVS